MEFCDFTRQHLLGSDTGVKVESQLQRAAWDRLRLVCRELDYAVPTLKQVELMSTSGLLRGPFDEFVLLPDPSNPHKLHLVNFNHGYFLGDVINLKPQESVSASG